MTTPTLAIVTSCSNGYGQYLVEWAASICKLIRKPDQVVVLTHGTEADREAGVAAAEQLRVAGLRVVQVHEQDLLNNLGIARNAAVALTDTEWVMHLDADDMVMPHALDDWAALQEYADVVSFGYERCGDLATGPRNRTKLYHTTQGPTTLADSTPCSGVSPFRRAFWDRAPYAIDLLGGWDTALWLGFAHLAARFVPTKRPCFWYRQHADSVFNVRRKAGWPAAKAGHELESRRRGDVGVSIIVPRSRTDKPWRVQAWMWIQRRYAVLFPEWEVVEGFGEAGHWVKGTAVYDGIKKAHGRTLVIADADCVVAPDILRQAVACVDAGAPWAMPHRLVYRLDQSTTAAILTREPGAALEAPTSGHERAPYMGFVGGGMVVINRANYLASGGFPRNFIGWGAEDEALGLILDTLLGKHERFPGDLIHLWHEPQITKDRYLSRGNRELHQRYRRAAGKVEEMWHLISPGRAGLGGPRGDADYLRETHAARQAQTREMLVHAGRR